MADHQSSRKTYGRGRRSVCSIINMGEDMALTKCRECGKQVSSKAATCPICGIKSPGRWKIGCFPGAIIAVVVFLVIGNLIEGSKPGNPYVSVPALPVKDGVYSQQHKTVQDIFRSNSEPVAKDALWTAPHIFKVGVINNGTSRDGYAQYVCGVLYEEGFRGKKIWVQIVDVVKLKNKGEWEKIGEARCL